MPGDEAKETMGRIFVDFLRKYSFEIRWCWGGLQKFNICHSSSLDLCMFVRSSWIFDLVSVVVFFC